MAIKFFLFLTMSFFEVPVPEIRVEGVVEEEECLEQENCNVCKFKKFKGPIARKYGIPMHDVKSFAKSVEKHERRYLKSDDDIAASFSLKYDFCSISRYLECKGEKGFLTLDAIQKHFTSCVYRSPKNRCILNIHKLDDHISNGLTPEMFYTENEDGPVFHAQNVHSLKELFSMKRIEIMNLKDLGKIL